MAARRRRCAGDESKESVFALSRSRPCESCNRGTGIIEILIENEHEESHELEEFKEDRDNDKEDREFCIPI